MNLFDEILHCPDENGWINPNVTRAEKLERLADRHAIEFARYVANHPKIFNNGASMEQVLSLFKIQNEN
jgi:hypothetical protein